MRYPFITELWFCQIQNPLIQMSYHFYWVVYCDMNTVHLFNRTHGVATPETLDYRQKIGKVVSSVSIADEKEEDIAFSVWIIMPAVSRYECFSAQGDLERVQVFGELTSIYRMEPIDSSRYRIHTWQDSVQWCCGLCFAMGGIQSWFFSLIVVSWAQKHGVRVILCIGYCFVRCPLLPLPDSVFDCLLWLN